METNERKNEVEINNSAIKKIDVNLYEVSKSICKIIYENKYQDYVAYGSGFFVKL